jgi:site-specific DNA-methyltransferase (adenine-specific)
MINIDEVKNTVVCKDAIELLKELPDTSVPLILTDVPYGVVNRKSAGIRNFDKEDADIVNFSMEDLIKEMVRVCSGSIYVFCGTEQVSELREGFAKSMTTRLCIWEKTNPSPVNGQHLWMSSMETCVFARKSKATFNEHCKSPVWRFPTVRSKRHQTEKPLNLFKYLIETSSKEGDLVVDPFVGSGTTCESALISNRFFYCGDISEKNIETVKERLQPYEIQQRES